MKKKILLFYIAMPLFLLGCSAEIEPFSEEGDNQQHDEQADQNQDESDEQENVSDESFELFDFEGTGDLVDFVTNNESALPDIGRNEGRYLAELTDNEDDKTLHFNNEQGRLDAKEVSFPFEFIARNIGIGTLEDSQTAPTPSGSLYIFCGVQVHVEDLNDVNSAHVVVGHRGNTHFTIEGKNTLNGNSSVNDIGANTVPDGRADIRIVGLENRTIKVYWQLPNLEYESVADDWIMYNETGDLPGTAPSFENTVYVGLITYAFGYNGVPFSGTCDAIQIQD
ncbi:hypothetical protein [Flagellimonas myxillae]|uniref:hypothetical protein n=1 Tax=Flagellimonas myxillae TaxID=2942214 RepID=UPI00201F0926|nr:hypothetical protein [Muricauda myxillae]MCL6265567.1 hypothetical protein [Muricauda myxillae]